MNEIDWDSVPVYEEFLPADAVFPCRLRVTTR